MYINNCDEVFYTITPDKSEYLHLCSDAIDPYANNSNIYLDYTRQLWRIIKNANGAYRIIPANSTTQYKTTNNINLQDDSQENDTANAYTYEYYGLRSWGGRGRKFKSCHSDQNRRFNRTSDFLLFSRKSSLNLSFS